MNTDDSNTTQHCAAVKAHYEKAAQDRDERLRNGTFNAAKVNHEMRYSIIASLLRKIGPVREGIDIGTGTGVWAEVLAGHCERVVGIDFAEENIKIARRNAAERHLDDRVSYVLGNAERLEEVGCATFAVATHISVLQHLQEKEESLRAVYRVLSPGGHLILLVQNRDCAYNRNLRHQRRNATELPINDYQSRSDTTELLRRVGFRIKEVRLCWPFLCDFVTSGATWPLLLPLLPARRATVGLLHAVSGLIGRLPVSSVLFREIVVLASKEMVR